MPRWGRFFDTAPGIYVHSDKMAEKADNCVGNAGHFWDGVFWASKWEVRLQSCGRREAPHRPVATAAKELGVRMIVLRVEGVNRSSFSLGAELELCWMLEASLHLERGGVRGGVTYRGPWSRELMAPEELRNLRKWFWREAKAEDNQKLHVPDTSNSKLKTEKGADDLFEGEVAGEA